MDVKEYLSQVIKLNHKISRMELRADEYKRMAESVPGCNFDEIRVDRTRSLDAPFVKWINKLLELEKEMETVRQRLDMAKAEIIGTIEKVEDEDCKSVLTLRYISCLTWEDIADKLCVVKRTTLKWHEKGLISVDSIINEK